MKLAGVSNQDNAVYFYRIVQPLKGIASQKLADVQYLPFYGQNLEYLTTSRKYLPFFESIGPWSDVLFSTVGSTREYFALLLGMKDQYKLPMIIDIDDDPTSVHTEPTNPAYQAYLASGSRHAEYAQMSMQIADIVTVSTPYLYERFKYINKHVIIVPNGIDTTLFKRQRRRKKKDFVIGYAGSGSHQKDLEFIAPAIKRIKKEFPHVKFKTIGPCTIPEIDERLQFTNFTEYPKALQAFHFDIGLAPIRDTLMSRAKSNLRWLEYTSLGIPTVCSDVEPFSHTHNVLKCSTQDDWYLAIRELILDEKKRNVLADAAYKEMKRDYDPQKIARKFFKEMNIIIHNNTGK